MGAGNDPVGTGDLFGFSGVSGLGIWIQKIGLLFLKYFCWGGGGGGSHETKKSIYTYPPEV